VKIALRHGIQCGLAILCLACAAATAQTNTQTAPKSTPAPSSSAALVCDPMALGAKADGKTKDTAAIQKAIDTCAAAGGGTVKLAAGTFLSAPLELKSHIHLEVDKGAMLLASSDMADFPDMRVLRENARKPFLYALNVEDIVISGGGVIDGSGDGWYKMAREHIDGESGAHRRPRLMIIDHCKDLTIDNMTFQNGASWQIVPYFCTNVTVTNTKVTAPADSPTTDGIDPFSCHHVRISHVWIDVGDDDVAVKSGLPGSHGVDDEPSTDVIVEDSTFLHGHGFSIGSETAGGMTDIHVRNIEMKGTKNGIRIKSGRDRGNAHIGDMTFDNIKMEDVIYPILISMYYPSELTIPDNDSAQPITIMTPKFYNMTFNNITISGGKIAGILAALPESPVTTITFSNVKISGSQKGFSIYNAIVPMHNVIIQPNSGPGILLKDRAKVINN